VSANVLTIDAAKKADLDVIENGKGTQAVHEVIVAMRANRRSGTACTKRKGEVAFSGANPGDKKGRVVLVRDTSPRRSGRGAVWPLVPDRATTRRKRRGP
jgi:ribosomal protein L4